MCHTKHGQVSPTSSLWGRNSIYDRAGALALVHAHDGSALTGFTRLAKIYRYQEASKVWLPYLRSCIFPCKIFNVAFQTEIMSKSCGSRGLRLYNTNPTHIKWLKPPGFLTFFFDALHPYTVSTTALPSSWMHCITTQSWLLLSTKISLSDSWVWVEKENIITHTAELHGCGLPSWLRCISARPPLWRCWGKPSIDPSQRERGSEGEERGKRKGVFRWQSGKTSQKRERTKRMKRT